MRLILLFLLVLLPVSHTLNFNFSQFDQGMPEILLEGDAVVKGDEIRLTETENQARVGRVVYNGRIPLWDTSSGKLADFASRFSFRIDSTEKNKSYGDGIAFFLAPVGFQIPPNSLGSYLGLFNTSTTDNPRTQIVAVEFDNVPNSWDPNYSHVGININSVSSSAVGEWNFSNHIGESADVRIVYNASIQDLSVTWGYGAAPKSMVHYKVDLKKILPQWVVVGISGITGVWVEVNAVESWEFSSSLDIIGDNKKMVIGLAVGLSLGLGCILIIVTVAFLVLRKRKREDFVEDRDLETTNLTRGAGPKRFSYKELATATNNFSNEKRLGQGGFGEVYKGYLIDMDIPIAVKKISRGSKQGKKEFTTEVKIISMLRHRNLVQLIGWCHDGGEFLLVYEFMPNGSLDYHLFGKTRNPLSWNLRYKIALGLASGLLYLHEEWEQCVLHRDIKSSNLMLDASFNVKLGDFGLARLMDHELGPKTTGLAGTLGYLAPEYVTTGRASKESDVYSFGVVALEIATGRKSVDPLDKETGKGLVEWVWDLYGSGELMAAVDEKLGGDFDRRQAECLMVVGLWCAHPDRNLRPSIRVAGHVLNFEAELPKLPGRMPVAVYHAASNPSGSSTETLISTDSSMNVGR